MKTLVVYFSLEGNTEYAATRIAASLGADTLRLVPKKAYKSKGFAKFVWGGKSAVIGEKPELEPYSIDLGAYNRVVFGFPVWASNFTPPLRTFILTHRNELQGKCVAAFACQAGSGAEKALGKLRECVGVEFFEAEAVFVDPKAKPDPATDGQIDAFCTRLAQAE